MCAEVRIVKNSWEELWEELIPTEKSCEELRSGGHSSKNWNKMRTNSQNRVQKMWGFTPAPLGFSFSPIVQHSLLLETSADCPVRVLLEIQMIIHEYYGLRMFTSCFVKASRMKHTDFQRAAPAPDAVRTKDASPMIYRLFGQIRWFIQLLTSI
jgi:hypothetical protein